MKKLISVFIVLVLILSFAGCSSGKTSYSNSYIGETAGDYYDSYYETPSASAENSEESFSSDSSTKIDENQSASGRKLIRNFELSVETLEFDSFVETVKKKVSEFGGYIENSSVNGSSYNYDSERYASLVCRVPADKLDEFINTVGGLGNITYSYEDTTDVTLTYVDMEARVSSLQTEYDRLLELLAEAESIDSIVTIEARLSEVRYQLESYESQLRTYDNLVDYSTVSLSVSEVKRITQTEKETVWQRISADFGDNIYDIWIGLQDFFVWFVANIPYFILLGIIAAIIIVIINLALRNNKKHQAKKAAKKAEKERRKAEKLAKKNPAAVPDEASVKETASEEKAPENEN